MKRPMEVEAALIMKADRHAKNAPWWKLMHARLVGERESFVSYRGHLVELAWLDDTPYLLELSEAAP